MGQESRKLREDIVQSRRQIGDAIDALGARIAVYPKPRATELDSLDDGEAALAPDAPAEGGFGSPLVLGIVSAVIGGVLGVVIPLGDAERRRLTGTP